MTSQIRLQLKGNEELIEKMTPKFVIGCKRILVCNDYLPIFVDKTNANLVTDPIKEITEKGIVTVDGTEREFDLIVYATGFKVYDSICGFDAVGRNGVNLHKHIDENYRSAYCGTSVNYFPNFFLCIGPNTGLAHNSIIFMIECIVNHIMGVLKQSIESGVDVVEVKERVLTEFEEDMDKGSEGRSYTSPTCASWYKHWSGKNRTLWPYGLVNFWLRSRDVDILRDYWLGYENNPLTLST